MRRGRELPPTCAPRGRFRRRRVRREELVQRGPVVRERRGAVHRAPRALPMRENDVRIAQRRLVLRRPHKRARPAAAARRRRRAHAAVHAECRGDALPQRGGRHRIASVDVLVRELRERPRLAGLRRAVLPDVRERRVPFVRALRLPRRDLVRHRRGRRVRARRAAHEERLDGGARRKDGRGESLERVGRQRPRVAPQERLLHATQRKRIAPRMRRGQVRRHALRIGRVDGRAHGGPVRLPLRGRRHVAHVALARRPARHRRARREAVAIVADALREAELDELRRIRREPLPMRPLPAKAEAPRHRRRHRIDTRARRGRHGAHDGRRRQAHGHERHERAQRRLVDEIRERKDAVLPRGGLRRLVKQLEPRGRAVRKAIVLPQQMRVPRKRPLRRRVVERVVVAIRHRRRVEPRRRGLGRRETRVLRFDVRIRHDAPRLGRGRRGAQRLLQRVRRQMREMQQRARPLCIVRARHLDHAHDAAALRLLDRLGPRRAVRQVAACRARRRPRIEVRARPTRDLDLVQRAAGLRQHLRQQLDALKHAEIRARLRRSRRRPCRRRWRGRLALDRLWPHLALAWSPALRTPRRRVRRRRALRAAQHHGARHVAEEARRHAHRRQRRSERRGIREHALARQRVRHRRHGRSAHGLVAHAERGAHRQTICLTPRRKAPRRIVADTALASTLLKRRTHSERRIRRRHPHDLPRQDLLDHALDLRRASQALRELVHRAAMRAVRIDQRQQLVLERRIVAQRDARGGRGRRRRRGACATAAAEPRVRRADVQRRRVRKLHTHTLHVPGR